MAALNLPQKYAINLNDFDSIFRIPEWRWKFLRTSYYKDFGQGIQYFVKQAKLELWLNGGKLTLVDINKQQFLPCLINYLVICEMQFGKELIEYAFSLVDKKSKAKFLDFFDKYLDSTFKDYNGIVSGVSSKLEYYKEWVKNKRNSQALITKSLRLSLFNLNPEQIEIIIHELTLKKVISKNNIQRLRSFLQNESQAEIKFKVSKIAVTDLLRRILFNPAPKYTKTRAAQELGNKLYYYNFKSKGFKPIPVKSLLNDFTDNAAIPKFEEKRLLIKFFPD
jgi:hypothetical protein